jgi:hypothetical protein
MYSDYYFYKSLADVRYMYTSDPYRIALPYTKAINYSFTYTKKSKEMFTEDQLAKTYNKQKETLY